MCICKIALSHDNITSNLHIHGSEKVQTQGPVFIIKHTEYMSIERHRFIHFSLGKKTTYTFSHRKEYNTISFSRSRRKSRRLSYDSY